MFVLISHIAISKFSWTAAFLKGLKSTTNLGPSKLRHPQGEEWLLLGDEMAGSWWLFSQLPIRTDFRQKVAPISTPQETWEAGKWGDWKLGVWCWKTRTKGKWKAWWKACTLCDLAFWLQIVVRFASWTTAGEQAGTWSVILTWDATWLAWVKLDSQSDRRWHIKKPIVFKHFAVTCFFSVFV